MNGLRKVLCLLMATTLGALALSSGAAFGADKTYTLTMSPLTGTSPIATMTATFANKGNSSFNSFTLKVPANYSVSGTPTTNRGDISYSGGVITVLNINLPVGTGQVVTVTMSGVATSGACGAGVTGDWTAVLWTGSGLTGNNFVLVNPSKTSTSISPSCYSVTPSSSGNGTISPSTVQTVASNATQSFTLNPATGYHIAPVTGSCGGTLVGNTFTTAAVTSNCTVIANFAINVYTVTPSAGANGSISPSTPQGVNYLGTKSFTLTPSTGYHIAPAGGSCGGSLAGNIYTTAQVTADCTVSASFAIDTFTIGASAGTGGTISPAGTTTVSYGGSQAYTIAGNTGFYITDVQVDNVSQGAPNSYTFSNVTANHTIAASFASKTLTITSSPTSAAVGTPFPVTVGLTPGGAIVTMTSDCATATSSGSGTSITFSVTIATMPSTGVCTITFSAPDYQTTALTNLKVYGGVLGCDDTNNYAHSPGGVLDPNAEVPASLDAGWGLRRGPNWDSGSCVPVNYNFTLDQTNNIANLIWDKATGQKASFKYVVVWPPVKVDAAGATAGWTQKRPNVSWETANTPVANTTDYVPALACAGDDLSFGHSLLPIIPNVPPFNTNPNAQYQPGQLAKMCVAQQGSASEGKDVSGNILVIYWDKVIDEADGWVGLP